MPYIIPYMKNTTLKRRKLGYILAVIYQKKYFLILSFYEIKRIKQALKENYKIEKRE
jgi:hypothetical protein